MVVCRLTGLGRLHLLNQQPGDASLNAFTSSEMNDPNRALDSNFNYPLSIQTNGNSANKQNIFSSISPTSGREMNHSPYPDSEDNEALSVDESDSDHKDDTISSLEDMKDGYDGSRTGKKRKRRVL